MNPQYSVREEVANSIIHGIGIFYAIAGLGVMMGLASVFGNAWHIVGCSIFGATQIIMFTTSTLYHSIPLQKAKNILRTLDHSAIFLLIAGTYTPFMLVNLRGPWGWSLFGVIWGLAVIGIILEASILKKFKAVRVLVYVAMGWAILIAIKPMLSSIGIEGLMMLLAGGLAYTIGVFFYIWHKLPYNHAIWHLFVLAGAVIHFFTILFYVIPIANL